jgi:uncharacterized protein YuzE
MDPELKIKFDPIADAIYIRLSERDIDEPGETVVDDFGTIIDRNLDGQARGFEFLNVRSLGVSVESLPADVARTVTDFISTGVLDSDSVVERDFP